MRPVHGQRYDWLNDDGSVPPPAMLCILPDWLRLYKITATTARNPATATVHAIVSEIFSDVEMLAFNSSPATPVMVDVVKVDVLDAAGGVDRVVVE